MAEWSKALVLGTSHFDGVGSNPTAAKFFFEVFFIFSPGRPLPPVPSNTNRPLPPTPPERSSPATHYKRLSGQGSTSPSGICFTQKQHQMVRQVKSSGEPH